MIQLIQRLITILLILFLATHAYASVSVVDEDQKAKDIDAVYYYFTKVKILMDQISKTSNSMAQLTSLDEIIKAENDLANACASHCNQDEFKQIHNQLNQLNNTLSGNFSKFSGMIDNSVRSLEDIRNFIAQIQGIPDNAKKAALSLQTAALQTEQQVSNTLIQLQALMLNQQSQAKLDQVIEKTNTKEAYSGLKSSGL
jgi:hypothetical protein